MNVLYECIEYSKHVLGFIIKKIFNLNISTNYKPEFSRRNTSHKSTYQSAAQSTYQTLCTLEGLESYMKSLEHQSLSVHYSWIIISNQ